MSQVIPVTEEMYQKYSDILKSNGIQKVIKEISIFRPDLKGDHLASTVDYITLKFEDGSEDLELFIKEKAKGSPVVTGMFDLMMVFEKESCFFNNFLPDAKKFCQSQLGNDDLLRCFSKKYYADNTCLVLENLTTRNYIMRDKTELQNLEEAKIVLQNMAKYQGVSYVMISEMGVDQFTTKYPMTAKESYMYDAMCDMFGPMFQNNINTCCKILETYPQEGTKETVEWLRSKIDDLFSQLCKRVTNDPEDTVLVLNHGDCWNNNMMFLKDSKTNEIIDHIFVDMQVTRYASPHLDISFFLCTSVKSEVRQADLETLLKVYYDTFKETVSLLNGNCTISFEEFQQDYKKKCFFGFICGLNMKTAIGAMKDMDDDKDHSDLEELKKYFNDVIGNWMKNNPEKATNIAIDVIGSVKEYRKLTED